MQTVILAAVSTEFARNIWHVFKNRPPKLRWFKVLKVKVALKTQNVFLDVALTICAIQVIPPAEMDNQLEPSVM